MENHFQIFFSNLSEKLVLNLKDQLFSKETSPFTKRFIIVPTAMMKSWITMQLAKNETLNIAMGFEILYLDEAVETLYETLTEEKFNHPTFLELALIVEKNLSDLMNEEDEIFESLKNYLKEKRIHEFSKMMATLFIQYGHFGKDLLSKWEASPNKEWQQALWKKIFCQESTLSYPYRDLTRFNPNLVKDNIQIHLFGISFLSPLYFNFFSFLSQLMPINLYLLSPCSLFWEDILSQKQIYSLKNKLKKSHFSQLEEYFENENPLLANFGNIGKMMLEQVESVNAITFEDYFLPHSLKNYPEYEDLNFEDINFYQKEEFTLLDAVRTDLILLRPLKSPLELKESDSLGVHIAPNKFREIEILHAKLIQLIADFKNNSFLPSDILVMSPQIDSYAPFIETVFNNPLSPLKAEILESSPLSLNPLLKAFFALLSLPNSKWSGLDFLELCDCKTFTQNFNLSDEDLYQIKDWILKTDLRWGITPEHRNAILKREYSEQDLIDQNPSGTWSYTFKKLLLSTIYDSEIKREAISGVDFSQAEILGKWIEIVESLEKDLKPILEGNKWNIDKWVHYLQTLYQAYFGQSSESLEVYHILEKELKKLLKAHSTIKEHLFPFLSIYDLILDSLSTGGKNKKDNIPSVRFSSLQPMRAIPSKVIALIGLDEENYPRVNNKSSLNEIVNNPLCDKIPSQTDYDRFLFLESILSARDHLYISYCGYSVSDGKDLLSSALVSELLTYLDQNYVINDKKPSEKIIIKHPFYAFDKSYFEENSPFKSYSKIDFSHAKAFYYHEKEASLNLIEPFGKMDEKKSENFISIVDLQELETFAKNPFKTLFQKSLRFTIDDLHLNKIKEEEDFELSSLQRYFLTKESLNKKSSEIFLEAQLKGNVPQGPFKKISFDEAEKRFLEIQKNLQNLKIDSKSLYTFKFSNRFLTPQLNGFIYELPSLQIPFKGVVIELQGSISNISEQGLLTLLENSKNNILKIWPTYLAYFYAVQNFNLPFLPDIIFPKSSKNLKLSPFFENPLEKLTDYMGFYMDYHTTPTPLPEWIPDLLKLSEVEFSNKLQKTYFSPFLENYNEYLKYAVRNKISFNFENIRFWKSKTSTLFSDLYVNWYEK